MGRHVHLSRGTNQTNSCSSYCGVPIYRRGCGETAPRRLVAPKKRDAKPGSHFSKRSFLFNCQSKKAEHALRAARKFLLHRPLCFVAKFKPREAQMQFTTVVIPLATPLGSNPTRSQMRPLFIKFFTGAVILVPFVLTPLTMPVTFRTNDFLRK